MVEWWNGIVEWNSGMPSCPKSLGAMHHNGSRIGECGYCPATGKMGPVFSTAASQALTCVSY